VGSPAHPREGTCSVGSLAPVGTHHINSCIVDQGMDPRVPLPPPVTQQKQCATSALHVIEYSR
jgi:hypothetical protein